MTAQIRRIYHNIHNEMFVSSGHIIVIVFTDEIEEATLISGSVIFVFVCIAAILVAWNWARRNGVIKRITRTGETEKSDRLTGKKGR